MPVDRTTRTLGIACIVPLLWGLTGTGGCASSRTFVLEPAATPRTHMATSLRCLPSTVEVSPALTTRFEEMLARKLGPETRVVAGGAGDLIIEYRFVLFDAGSPAARVGAGVASLAGSPFYGLGDGALGLDVTFTDVAGRVVGHIVVDGPISGAFGSAESGVATAAASIARFTKANFVPEASGAGTPLQEPHLPRVSASPL
jgi:hypothetical protein